MNPGHPGTPNPARSRPSALSLDRGASGGPIEALVALAITAEGLLDGPDDRESLSSTLAVLGQSMGFSGAGVWEHRTDEPGVYTVHARWRENESHAPSRVDSTAVGLAEVHDALMAGRGMEVWYDTTTDAIRQTLDMYNDEGFLIVPVTNAEGTWGGAVFARRKGDRTPWSTLSRTTLRTIAALFGAAVRRRDDAARAERLREALEHSHREEGLATLAAGIAHDISNMLGVLRTGLDLAELRGEFVAQDVKRMENAFGAAKALVEELYGFATVDKPPPVDIDLPRLLRRGQLLLSGRRPDGVTVIVELPHDLPTVPGHVTQVGQAIGNLVLNAVEAAAPTGGTVRITGAAVARHGRPGVLLCVDDDGPGVPEAMRARLFKPLVSTKGARRGIGLASAASIARSHGGSLNLVDHDEPGAHFELWLPT